MYVYHVVTNKDIMCLYLNANAEPIILPELFLYSNRHYAYLKVSNLLCSLQLRQTEIYMARERIIG